MTERNGMRYGLLGLIVLSLLIALGLIVATQSSPTSEPAAPSATAAPVLESLAALDGRAPAAGCDWVRAINQWAVCKHCRQKTGGGLVILLVHARHSGGAATNPGQAPVLRSTRAAARRGLDYHGPHHVHLLTPQPPVQPRR